MSAPLSIAFLIGPTGQVRTARSLEQVEHELRYKGTKTNTPRTLKMPEGLIDALRAHQVDQRRHREAFGADYANLDLICCRPDGGMVYPDCFSATFSKHMARIGRVGLTFHSLRHSHSSILISAGTPVTAVSKRLGHARTSMTLGTYSHCFHEEDEEKAAGVMDKVFGHAPDTLKDAQRQ